MQKSLFNPTYIWKILFSNKNIDKISLLMGWGLFACTTVLYVLLLATIVALVKIPNEPHDYHLLLRLLTILIILAFFVGANASVWLIFAFSSNQRLNEKRKILKIVCLITFNFGGYYIIDYLIEKFRDLETEISAVLLTNEHVLNKKNQLWQFFFILFSMVSLVTFAPMAVLSCWVLSESRYVYLEESEIRDRISLGLESLFCLFPVFSFLHFFHNAKNGLYIAWLSEIAQDEEQAVQTKTFWKKSSNFWIWLVYGLMMVSFLTFLAFLLAFLFPSTTTASLAQLKTQIYFVVLFWPLVTLLLLYFDIYKKYLYELDHKIPLPILIFEILTLNFLMFPISLTFLLKNATEIQKTNFGWKTELDKGFFWLFAIILTNTLLIYFFSLTTVFFFQLLFSNSLELEVVVGFVLLCIFCFCHLFLNLVKIWNYKNYLNNLTSWFITDLLTFNFLGLIGDSFSQVQKNKLINQLVWI